MPMQQVEFEFPDPDKEEGRGENTVDKGEKEQVSGRGEVEIEVVDDTPEQDRGRKPSPPPQDVTDEELKDYSEKVQKRIQHFSKGYHDERRAKEEAMRQRDEMQRLTKQLYQEVQQLRNNNDRSQNVMIEQAKRQVENELAVAKRMYKDAYESGDPDALLAAQEALTTAKIRADKVSAFKPKPLQTNENNVQSDTIEPPTRPSPTPAQTQRVQVDPKAEEWRRNNEWYGIDRGMTNYVMAYHQELIDGGVDPRSDEYYEKINSRMRRMFPEKFGGSEAEATTTRSTTVVAPATRSTAPKKVRLTQTQVDLTKRLGITPEQYAIEAAKLMRKQ